MPVLHKLVKILMLFIFVLTALVFTYLAWQEHFSLTSTQWLNSPIWQSPYRYSWFIVIFGLGSMVGIPRQAIAFSAGYAFELYFAVPIALMCAVLGCIGGFYLARFVLAQWLKQRFHNTHQKLAVFFEQQTLKKAIALRLLPLGSNLLITLIAGVSGAKPVVFFIGSAIGYLPQMLLFCFIGAGFTSLSEQQWPLAALATIVSIVLFYLAFRRPKKADILK